MPKVPVQKLNRDKLYNVDEVDMQMNFGERLRKYFKPHDTVKVQNVDSEVIEWQFLEEDKENFTIEDDSNIKIVTRDDPDLWRIEPGDVDILEGCCAYLMIEALFKQMTARKVGPVEHPLDQRDIRNFAFDDPAAQDNFIKRVFLGKITPQMMKEAALAQLEGESSAPESTVTGAKRTVSPISKAA